MDVGRCRSQTRSGNGRPRWPAPTSSARLERQTEWASEGAECSGPRRPQHPLGYVAPSERNGRARHPRSGTMQRLSLLGVCLVTFLIGALSAPALEVKDKTKAPSGWWEANAPMAIPPQYFDQILSAYGLT